MKLNRKKVLVTGGRGFIGQRLIGKLNNLNAKVSSFDLEDGQNITDQSLIEKTIKNNYDFIYHLAAFSGNKESLDHYNLVFKVNTLATILLMEGVAKFSPKTKIIISSSRLEYGNPQYLPVDEKHPTQPTSPYGLSKLLATQMAQIYSMSKKIRFTVYRTSNVYGPHKNSRFLGYNLINHFIDIAEKNGTLKIFGNGEQQRDYLFIDDIVEAFLLATNPESDNKIYNLGFGQGVSLLEMAQLITKILHKGRISKVKWPKNWQSVETGSYVSDIRKINREIGFKPKISFADGIKRTINNN